MENTQTETVQHETKGPSPMENTHTETVQHETKGPSASDLFSIDPGLVIWTWITFLILFLVLKKFAWKPLMSAVEKRERMFADAAENAKKVQEALEKTSDERKSMLSETDRQTREIIQKGRETGEKVAKDIEEKARVTAEKMLEEAKQQISGEKERAIAELKEETVDMVIQTTSRLIDESLDDEGHRKIVNRFLEEI